MFLEVEEGGKDPDEEAVKVYLIRFIADLSHQNHVCQNIHNEKITQTYNQPI